MVTTSFRFLAASVILTASLLTILVSVPVPAQGRQEDYRSLTVRTPDGLTIAVQQWGNPSGPEILFVHGFSQSHLSWVKQTRSDLAQAFRVITYDTRGHGGSDKPLGSFYDNVGHSPFWEDPARFNSELAAFVRASASR
ncbi:MAG: alpha/beta fold hydrolase [Candidatus Rokubacteria bacterium]|nr:alpha/beta fold hydrolase [Candidatus Rokubacteria bacterium]